MQIIIDIDENYYEIIKHDVQCGSDYLPFKLIANGTPLPKYGWIPCSERLPEEIGTYLVTLDYEEHGTGITAVWYHGKQIGWDLSFADVVIAWQPLPEPYKAESENEECL